MKLSISIAGVAVLALVLSGCSSTPIRPDPAPSIQPAGDSSANEEVTRTFRDRLDGDINLVLADNRQLYSPLGLGMLALGVGAAAPLANDSADQDIRDWYQHHIKQKGLDPLATTASIGGQAWVI